VINFGYKQKKEKLSKIFSNSC